MDVSVCLFVCTINSKRLKLKSTNLAKGESITSPRLPISIRCKFKSQGHSVTKCKKVIEWVSEIFDVNMLHIIVTVEEEQEEEEEEREEGEQEEEHLIEQKQAKQTTISNNNNTRRGRKLKRHEPSMLTYIRIYKFTIDIKLYRPNRRKTENRKHKRNRTNTL